LGAESGSRAAPLAAARAVDAADAMGYDEGFPLVWGLSPSIVPR